MLCTTTIVSGLEIHRPAFANPTAAAGMFLPNRAEGTYEASGGTVDITDYTSTHMEGSFSLDFQDENQLSGRFDVSFFEQLMWSSLSDTIRGRVRNHRIRLL
jgi:hypothetical protein